MFETFAMTDDNAEGDLVASQLKEMQDQIKSLRTKFESAEARAQQAEETVRNAGIVAGTVETVHTSNHAKISTPRFIKGMSFDGYKKQVAAWQLMKVCPEHQEGLLLFMELPTDDAFGGLQSHVESIVGLENLGKAGGAKKLLDALQKVIEKPEISRLREWWAQISQIRQRPGWNMERYILEVNKLIKQGREHYKVLLPNRVHASILTNGVTSIDQTMVAVLIKDIKLDGTGDEEADLHSQCEAALRNYVPAGRNVHEVHVARDVFGNELRRASVPSVGSEEEVYYGQGGNLVKKPQVKRKFGQQMPKDEWEQHKKTCLKRGECFYCGSREHMARACPVQKKKMEERKRAHLAQGKVWDNRDGTFAHPDGTTRNSSSVILRGAGGGQDEANRVAYVANYQVGDSWGDAGSSRPKSILFGDMQSHEHYDPSHYDPNFDPNHLVFENFEPEEDLKMKADDEMKEGDEKKEGNEKKEDENPQDDDAIKKIDKFLEDDGHDDVFVVNVPKCNVDVNSDVLTTYCARKEAILDTGCSKSCASEDWTKGYIENLSGEDKKRVVKKVSNNSFRFGDNQVYRSQGYIEAPVWIGGKRRTLGWDILPQTTIPLLISLKVMKKLQMGIQLYEGNVDIATVEGVSFKVEHRQDHLWLDISPRHEEDQENDCGSVLLVIKNERADLLKMHEQWSHPPRTRMISMIKRAGQWRDSMEAVIEEIYKNCHSRDCRAREETQKVRKVGTKLPTMPGQMVAMDLKISSGNDKNILYILDLFSNFVVAEMIDSKKPEHIAEKLLQSWYSKGFPNIGTLVSDCGSEFISGEMIHLCERLNIRHRTGPPRTPQYNGQCERIHAIVDANAAMMRDGRPQMTQQEALSWAVFAWNTTETRGGYCPRHIMFGPQDVESNILDQGPTELQDYSGCLKRLFDARNEARINHLTLKASSKIREALYRKTIPTIDSKPIGSWVWVRRSLESNWMGPGRISHSLDWECSVKIKNKFFTARHEDCLLLTKREIEIEGLNAPEADVDVDHEFNNAEPNEVEVETVHTRRTLTHNQPISSSADSSSSPPVSSGDIPSSEPISNDNVQDVVEGPNAEPSSGQENQVQAKGARGKKGKRGTSKSKVRVQEFDLKRGTKIEMVDALTNKWIPVHVNHRVRKGKQSNVEFYNVTVSGYDKQVVDLKMMDWRYAPEAGGEGRGCQSGRIQRMLCIDDAAAPAHLDSEATEQDLTTPLQSDEKNPSEEDDLQVGGDNITRDVGNEKVSDVRIVNDETHQVCVVQVPFNLHKTDRVVNAKAKELQTLRKFGTFIDIDIRTLNAEQRNKIIPTTWNVVQKDVNNPDSIKARLCARGDKEKGDVRTDSPTVSRQALRLLITKAAQNHWKLKSLDFTGAFLQGMDIDRVVYLSPPPDVREQNPNLVWKVVKRLYGFKDSSRGWYLEFDRAMKELGCESILCDNAMYVFKMKGKIVGLAGVHVDDVLFCGEDIFHQMVINKLLSKYVIGKIDIEDFCFTGWSLTQDQSGIELTQKHFLDQVNIDKYSVFRAISGDKKEVLNEDLQALFRSMIGSIQWIIQVSRPDKAYYGVALASKLGKATVNDAKVGYKQLKSMLDDPQIIKYNVLQDSGDCHLRVFTDSSWGKLDNVETVNGILVFLVDSKGRACLIDWQSYKLAIPVSSPLAGEAVAALDGYNKIPWIRSLAEDLGFGKLPATMMVDSRSLCEAVKATTTMKDKRAMVGICALRRAPDIAAEDLKIKWCDATSQVADPLTKGGVNPDLLRAVLQFGQLDIVGVENTELMRRKQENDYAS